MVEISRNKAAELLGYTLKEFNELRREYPEIHDWLVCGATLKYHGYSVGQVLFSASRKFKPEMSDLINELILKDKQIAKLEKEIHALQSEQVQAS